MAPTREVDKIVAMSPRPREMQVLCLGLSRTSTMTMYTALNRLGYRCYHMYESSMNYRHRHMCCWLEAINFKVNGIGKPYYPEDFDKILQEYSAVSDMPCVNFSKELLEAFPNAKVVLTQRDPDKWLESIDNSIYRILRWKIWPFLKWVEPDGMGAFYDCMKLCIADWTAPMPWNDREALRSYMPKHVEYIRSLVPPENLLEFHPSDGWDPLCKFLGKEAPKESFPFVNKGNSVTNLAKFAITLKLVKHAMPYLMAGGVAIFAFTKASG